VTEGGLIAKMDKSKLPHASKIICCVYVLFSFVLLQVSLDCPFLIAPSVFSNVYFGFSNMPNILACNIGIVIAIVQD